MSNGEMMPALWVLVSPNQASLKVNAGGLLRCRLVSARISLSFCMTFVGN